MRHTHNTWAMSS